MKTKLPTWVWKMCHVCGWQQLIKRTTKAPTCIYCHTKDGMSVDICSPYKIGERYTLRTDCA